MTTFVSSVTAPLRASSLPATNAPVFVVMEVRAKMFPMKLVPVPRVAELPTCQKIFADWAPFIAVTAALLAVVRVEPIWKTKMALAFPKPFSVSVPVSCAELAKK